MNRREWLRLGAALLLGAALALPLGMMLARDGDPPLAPAKPQAERRAVFSPDVRGDAYFLSQLRSQVETLEAYCENTRNMCAEARAARRRYDRLATRR